MTTKKLPLAFVLIFVLISAKSAERTPNQLPVSKFFTEKVKRKKKMSKNIFDDTTVEINVDPDNDDVVVPAIILANAAPVIPIIDLVSETSSDNGVEILEEVTSTTTPRPNSRASLRCLVPWAGLNQHPNK